MERSDRLVGPPLVGRCYLVPCVRYDLRGLVSNWPVMGPRHADAEHLNFPAVHYHLDLRFLSRHQLEWIGCSWRGPEVEAAALPLSEHRDGTHGPLPEPTLRRLRCRRADHGYPTERVAKARGFRALWAAYAGRRCRRGKAGFICPHRHFPLASIVALDGIITCPLHGLRIDAASGIVLPPWEAAGERSDAFLENAAQEPRIREVPFE